MKPRLAALLILGVVLLGLSQALRAFFPTEAPTAAIQAQSTQNTRTRTVNAVFTSTNKGGVVTDVYVTASESPDGATVTLEVSRYRPTCKDNGCPDVMRHAFNQMPLAAGSLQFGKALNSATLKATLPVSDRLKKHGADSVTLDLTWTAVGRMARDEHEEGERFQPASASGSIRSGKTNFTPKKSIDGEMEEWG